MSVGYYANLVVGVEYDELIEEFDEEKFVIKYNEDTGEPYEKPVSIKCIKIGEKIFKDRTLGDILEGLGWDQREDDICILSFDYDGNEEMVGIVVGETNWNSFYVTIDENKLKQTEEKVKKEFDKVGYTGEIKKFVALRVS